MKGKMSTRMDNTSHFLDSRMEASIEKHLFQFMNFFCNPAKNISTTCDTSIRFIISFSGIAKQPNSTRLLINQVLKALQMRTLLKRQVTHEDQRPKSVKLAICPFGVIRMYFQKRRKEKNKWKKNHVT